MIPIEYKERVDLRFLRQTVEMTLRFLRTKVRTSFSDRLVLEAATLTGVTISKVVNADMSAANAEHLRALNTLVGHLSAATTTVHQTRMIQWEMTQLVSMLRKYQTSTRHLPKSYSNERTTSARKQIWSMQTVLAPHFASPRITWSQSYVSYRWLDTQLHIIINAWKHIYMWLWQEIGLEGLNWCAGCAICYSMTPIVTWVYEYQ